MNRTEPDESSLRRTLLSPWSVLSGTTFLYWLGAHSLKPFVTLRLDDLGASDAFIGVAVVLAPTVSLFAAIPGGRLIDRTGARRILAGSLVGMVLVGIGFASAASPQAILGLQAAIGLAEIGAWLALQALVTHAGSGLFRTRQLALFSFAWGAGIAIGPVLGAGLFDVVGFTALGWVYAGASLLALATVLAVPRPTFTRTHGAEETHSIGATVRSIGVRPAIVAVLLSSYVNLAVAAIRNSFYPLFLERQGIGIARIGLLLAVAAVMSLAIRLGLPILVRRFGVVRLLLWSMTVSTVALAVTPVLPGVTTLALAAALMGAAVGMNPPLTVELMAENTGEAERGVAMGMRITANRLAQVIQPAVFTGLTALVGMAGAFPLSGLPLLIVTGFAVRAANHSELGEPHASGSAGPSSRH